MWKEINYVWIQYFWASLKGNGPEAVVQTVAYAAIALTLVPVVRRVVRAEMKKAHAELQGIEAEVKTIERKFGKLVKLPWRGLVKLASTVLRVRVTVKDVQAVDAAGKVVDSVAPALAPAVAVIEKVAGDAEQTTAADTMKAR